MSKSKENNINKIGERLIKNIDLYGFSTMCIFLILLTIGFIYEWKKGALDWE